MQFLSFRVLWSRFKAIRFMMADKTVPKGKKALVIVGILYFILPIDLIPIVVFPLGLLDDIALWIFILWYLRKELDNYWTGEKSKDLSKKYKGNRVVDDVEFEVEGEEATEAHVNGSHSGNSDAKE